MKWTKIQPILFHTCEGGIGEVKGDPHNLPKKNIRGVMGSKSQIECLVC